ncbi:MAG: hypothetical protein IJA61_02585 [Clostridia bacterium]|nr:hypothetical protein [Clostridia bacterium]
MAREVVAPYRKVAAEALYNWYRDEVGTPENAVKLAKEMTVEELDQKVDAKSSMTHAVKTFARAVGLKISEAADLTNLVIGNNDSPTLSASQAKALMDYSMAIKPITNLESVILDTIAGTHDGWVVDKAGKFAQEGRESRKYQHLPVEMIGWKEAKADLLFISPIMEAMGVKVDESKLEKAYNERVANFFERNGFVQDGRIVEDRLATAIAAGKAFYKPLTEKNTATMDEAKLMVSQVKEKVGPILERSQVME